MRRMLLIAGIVLASAMPAAHSAGAQGALDRGWRLVYATDSAGRVSAGDKAALLRAVRAGLPVRVGFAISWRAKDGSQDGVEHVADARFLTIHRDEVSAQLAPILGQAPAEGAPDVALMTTGDRLWYALVDSRGRLQGYFTGGGAVTSLTVATHWFVAGTPASPAGTLY
ncbi:MAG: hypothetical protein HY275_14305 [Gemmatimonadetes bacterium]|nr:hypothetical protein [Gemmatimonadota bacterium]